MSTRKKFTHIAGSTFGAITVRYCAMLPVWGVLAVAPVAASAQTIAHWTNVSGGAYETPSNWLANLAPQFDWQTRFAFSGSYPVEFNADHAIVDVTVAGDSHPTFSIGGNQSTDRTYDLSGHLRVEDEAQLTIESGTGSGRFHLDVFRNVTVDGLPNNPDAGVLTLRDGATITSTSLQAGLAAGTQGRVLITGADTQWNTVFMAAGSRGDSELTVAAGASLIVDNDTTLAFDNGSTSQVNIDGVGTDGLPSTWIVNNAPVEIGDGGSGILNVTGGARVMHSQVVLANFSGSSGVAHIGGVDAAGNASTWTTGNLVASFFGGISELTVDEGGQVLSNHVILAGNGRSTATIAGTSPSGAPSSWTVAGELDIAIGPTTGDIFIRDGGHLSTTTTNMGTAVVDTTARVELSTTDPSAPSTWMNSGDLFVAGDENGIGSRGLVDLNDNSRVDVGGTIKLFSRGTVRVRDESLLVADRIDNSDAGDFEQTGGEVQFNRFDGNLIHSAGTIAPGIGGSGALLVGDFTQQDSATLELEVGGLIGAHDAFSITGAADIDGSLQLSLINGFTPSPTDTFEVLTASSLLGFFDNAVNSQRITTIDGRGSFVVNYGIGSPFDANQIVLSDFMLEAILLGDYDGSGLVGAGDLDLVLGAWGEDVSVTGVPAGWINEVPTGLVGAAQLDVVLSNWGASNSATLIAVPEPASVWLVWLVVAAFARTRASSRSAPL